MVSTGLRQTIKEVVASVAYDRIVLFGSHARGDNTEQSDVDVLVICPAFYLLESLQKQILEGQPHMDRLVRLYPKTKLRNLFEPQWHPL